MQTYKLADAVWACSHDAITQHIHYHLILNIVGKQLCEFACSHQLVTAVHDALIGMYFATTPSQKCYIHIATAHRDTYHNAGVLHQDLSIGNVVIYCGKGILIDWDLSKLINFKSARQITRTVRSF
jgi:hypothetical protein